MLNSVIKLPIKINCRRISLLLKIKLSLSEIIEEKRRSVSYYSLVRNLVNSLYKKNNRQKRSRSHRAWAIAYLLYKLTRAPNRMRQ